MTKGQRKRSHIRRLRRILNNAKEFFVGNVSTTKLLRHRYGDGINKSNLTEE